MYLRERTQWLYLWLAIYLLADGLIGFRRLDAMNYGLDFVTLQVYLQFVESAQDISLWLLLLTLFGLSGEARWRRWTKILAAIYLTSQVIDIATFFPWQYAGPGLQWTDAITTGLYTLAPLFIFFIVGFGAGTKKADDAVAAGHRRVSLRRLQHDVPTLRTGHGDSRTGR